MHISSLRMPSICSAPSYRRCWSASKEYDHAETRFVQYLHKKQLLIVKLRYMVMGGIIIKAIRLMLFVLIPGMLVASGSAWEGSDMQLPDGSHNNDLGYPNTYPNYPGYYPTYTYPTYYYTTPMVYPTYYYNPVVYNYYDSCNSWSCNPCTIDSYSSNGCVHAPMNCDDGNPCTVDSCGPNGCVHTPVKCDDRNPRTVDSCSSNGCVHTPVNCDDRKPCADEPCSFMSI